MFAYQINDRKISSRQELPAPTCAATIFDDLLALSLQDGTLWMLDIKCLIPVYPIIITNFPANILKACDKNLIVINYDNTICIFQRQSKQCIQKIFEKKLPQMTLDYLGIDLTIEIDSLKVTPILFFKEKEIIYSYTQRAFLAHRFPCPSELSYTIHPVQFLIDLENIITNSLLLKENFDKTYNEIMRVCYECGDLSFIQKWTDFGKQFHLYYDEIFITSKKRRMEISYYNKVNSLIQRAEYFEKKAAEFRKRALQIPFPILVDNSPINSSIDLPLIQPPNVDHFDYIDIYTEQISPDLYIDNEGSIQKLTFLITDSQSPEYSNSPSNSQNYCSLESACLAKNDQEDDDSENEIPNAQPTSDRLSTESESDTENTFEPQEEEHDSKNNHVISQIKQENSTDQTLRNHEQPPDKEIETDESSDFEIHFGTLSDDSQSASQKSQKINDEKSKSIIEMTLSQILSQK